MEITEWNIVLNQWSDRIVFAWILFVFKQYYVYHMQFALECAKNDPCEIAPIQFLFVTIDNKDSISIAFSWIVILYYSITCSHCHHSFLQFLVIQHLKFSISQYPNQWNIQKLNYTINYK